MAPLARLLQGLEQSLGRMRHPAGIQAVRQLPQQGWLPLLMGRQWSVAAINALAIEPAAHHLRPVQAVLIERVAQLQDQLQPLGVQAVVLLPRALMP